MAKKPTLDDMRLALDKVLPHHQREANKAKFLEGAESKERMYHATGDDFTEFNPNKSSEEGKFGQGIYMTPQTRHANFFANIRAKQGKNSQIMPVHTNIKNPYKIHGHQNIPFNKIDKNKLQALGHDGIFYYDDSGDLKEAVAFHPTQVKSAIGNRGTYDTTNPDITKAKGGSVPRHNFVKHKHGEKVGGYDVGDKIKNYGSYASSGIDDIESGIHRVPMSAFEVTHPNKLFYAKDDIDHVHKLAEKIKQNKYMDPLLVAMDEKGAYVVEGGHRLGAAHLLGMKEIPAMIGYEPDDYAKGGEVLYHGTPHTKTVIKRFQPKGGGDFGAGIYMTTSPHSASEFSKGIHGDQHGAVYPLIANIKNPLKIKDKYEMNHIYDSNDSGKPIHEYLQSKGYDGIHVTKPNEDSDEQYFVAFHPKQVKSSITGKAKGGNVMPKYPSIEEMLQKLQESGRTPIMPAPDRWFKKPEQHPYQQKAIEKLLEQTGHGREAFPFGAHINPVTGEPLDFEIMHDLGVAIDPVTGTPRMSGIKSGLTEIDPRLGSLTKSNLIRKGLFKHEGGDPLLDRIKFLATIEKSGKGHHYGLSTHYESPAELVQEMRGNPTLRPHSRGDIYGVGDEVGRISIKGMHHPVFEKLVVAPSGMNVQGKKLHKANGGKVTHAHHLEIEERPL